MHAFILAGGFATRLWPLTEKRAKPLLPLAGEPLISRIVHKIPDEIPVTVSTNAAFEDDFKTWKEELGRENIEVLIEDTKSDDQKLGALGAVAQWIEAANINDDVLLLTGDNEFGFAFADFLDAFDGETTLIAAHDIGDREKAKSFGVVALEEAAAVASGNAAGVHEPQLHKVGKVQKFQEKPASPLSTLINTGCSLLPSSTLPILLEFAKIKPDNVGGIFEELLSKGKSIQCFSFTEPWFDIGSFGAYLEATKTLVGEKILEGEDSQVTDSTFQGSIVLGPRCQIQDSTMENVVCFGDCRITDYILKNCILDTGCILEGVDITGKMLREGMNLAKKR